MNSGGRATASKLHAAFDAAGIGIITLWCLWRADNAEPTASKLKRTAIAFVVIVSGATAVWLVIAAIYAARGHLHELLYSNFLFNRAYRARDHLHVIANVLQTAKLTALMALAVSVAITAAFFAQLRGDRRAAFWRLDRGPALSIVWIACASLAILSNALVLTHYVLQLAPARCVFAGVSLDVLLTNGIVSKRSLGIIGVAAAAGLGLVTLHVFKIVQQIRAAPEAAAVIGQYLRDHTAADDAIFSYDDGPAYYVYAGRRVPTRFSFPYWYGD